jgi:hypothetical protein
VDEAVRLFERKGDVTDARQAVARLATLSRPPIETGA